MKNQGDLKCCVIYVDVIVADAGRIAAVETIMDLETGTAAAAVPAAVVETITESAEETQGNAAAPVPAVTVTAAETTAAQAAGIQGTAAAAAVIVTAAETIAV